MKTIAFRVLLGATLVLITAIILIAGVPHGCTQMSIREKSESAGFNGSFEIEKSGLPVNWYIYYPPIKNGDAEISLDSMDAVEGNQSLKFIVHRADSRGGWTTAGLFQVRPAKAKTSYKVSFWLKNQGCTTSLLIRSEKPMLSPPANRRVLGEKETGTNTWRQFEYVYTVPETYDNIRFELSIVQPGTLWIDDVRSEEVQTH